MIRRGYYSSNNFQDSNKRKSTKNKILGYLPRVLFFNVFGLGAVISEAPENNLRQRCHKGT
jgi:hypothetical protein